GWATNTFSRHSVSGVNVVSHPTGDVTVPSRAIETFHNAPRAVSAISRSPLDVNCSPLATNGCAVPGGNVTSLRPTPAELAIGCTRNIRCAMPSGVTFQTRPRPVVPSPVQRLPSRSKARPLVPVTPVVKIVATGIGPVAL